MDCHTPAVGMPQLPRNLQWEKEGICYLGVYIGTPTIMAKNWLNTVYKIDNRLEKWRGILLTLSYRGHALMINNLLGSLWHKMIALHPPEALLLTIQKHLLDFFWGGKHWVKPEVLYLPLADSGHGFIDILSRLMAFRLATVHRFLFSASLPWHHTANHLLKMAGMLNFNQKLFLMDLQHVDIFPLPLFYQDLLQA